MNDIYGKYFNITTAGLLSLKDEYKPTGDKYEQLPTTIVIPSTVNDTEVTTLAENMFKQNTRIVSIVLPNTVTTIPKYFCSEAYQLVDVQNTDSITTINDNAFDNTSLQRVTFNNVTTVGVNVFKCCAELKYLQMNKLRVLSKGLLYGCAELITLDVPSCTTIGESALFMTERLEDFKHSTITSIERYALNQSAYRLSDSERSKVTTNASRVASLWSNKAFVDCWLDLCANNIDNAIIHPALYSYPQDDEPWSDNVSADISNIDWFNWGDYDPVTKKYSKYLSDFSFNNYFNKDYAGDLANQEIYFPSPIDTSTGCTLHSILGAYIGLLQPFGKSIVQCPKQIQDYIVRITGGRDEWGIPRLINEWAASDPVYGDESKVTHKWYSGYKNSNSKFRYYDHKTYGPTVVFNTNYFSTFVANRIGLKCEILGLNHGDYRPPADSDFENVDVVSSYLQDSSNWEDYLLYFINALKNGCYAMLCGPGGAGSTQGHATLIYGIDKEGYVYINNTSHFHHRDDDYDGQVCRIPFENVFTLCNAISQSGGNYTAHTNNGTYPITIISKASIAPRLTNCFKDNCDAMLQDKESTLETFTGLADSIALVSDNVDWNVLQELRDSEELYEPCSSDKYYEQNKPDVHIKTSQSIMSFKACGTGSITVRTHSGYNSYTLTDEPQTITVDNHTLTAVNEDFPQPLYTIFINNAENITELDLHDTGVTELHFNRQNGINKLLIYNNDISELNVAECRNLQYLHMFNNPICSDIDKMRDIIKQLPDRNNKAFGSIILYDWVNLGLCGYRKALNNTFYHDKEYKYPLKKCENEIYRDIASVEHPWYQYIGGRFVELSDYNRMIMLRRQLEGLDKSTWTYTNKEGSIFKNWVFGSAIQYNEEAWKYCDTPFRNAHIADVWETAEKGEGVGITSVDCNNWIHPSVNFNRVHAFGWVGWEPDGWSTTGGVAPVPVFTSEDEIDTNIKNVLCPWLEPGCYKVFSDIIIIPTPDDERKLSTLKREDGTEEAFKLLTSDHGESCYSFMGDRGITSITNTTYGISPESRYYLLSTASASKNQSVAWHESTQADWTALVARGCGVYVSDLSNASQVYYNNNCHPQSNITCVNMDDINLFTRSLGQQFVGDVKTPSYQFQNELNSQSLQRIFAFNAQGNDGDGFPYTTDSPSNTATSYIMSENCRFVSSISLDKQFSAFSTADVSKQPHSYTYSCYGESVRYYNTALKSIVCGSGTSFATPLHTAMTAILWVIYSKIHNLYRLNSDSEWRISSSYESRKILEKSYKHHIDPLKGQARLAVGNGTVDCMYYNTLSYPTVSNTKLNINSDNNLSVGNVIQLEKTCCVHPSEAESDGFFIGNNITATPLVYNQQYFIPLRSGTHTLSCYNNNLNIIPDKNTLSGFTNDTTSDSFISSTTFEVSAGELNGECITDGLIYNKSITAAAAQTPISEFNKCNNDLGWTVSFALNPKGAGAGSNGTAEMLKTDYFYLKFEVILTNRVLQERKGELWLRMRDAVMGREDCDYTYLAMDKHTQNCNHSYTVDEVVYPYSYDSAGGYLYQCRNIKSVITLRKRANDNILDFFINGQYITSHRTLQDLSGLPYTGGIIPCANVSNATKIVNCISICIHNRPLTEDEIIQQMLYMHKTYCS